jgi:hypothetical protein
MDTNKATPDLKPSAQPPSPEDLMEARRVDEEGSKVPARDRPVEETTGADMRNNNNRSRPNNNRSRLTIAIWTQELATFTKSM